MNKYYLSDGRAKDGPFIIDELRVKNIRPETVIWTDGMSGWSKAGEIEDLKVLFLGPPPLPNQIFKSRQLSVFILSAVSRRGLFVSRTSEFCCDVSAKRNCIAAICYTWQGDHGHTT